MREFFHSSICLMIITYYKKYYSLVVVIKGVQLRNVISLSKLLLDKQSKRYLIVDNDNKSTNCRLYDPVSHQIKVSYYIIFNENRNEILHIASS